MSKTYSDLIQRIEKSFPDIDSDITVDLLASNKEYADLFHQVAELKQACPLIDNVLEDEGEITMTAEEHAMLVKCLQLSRKMDDMERLHIYFRGHTDAFAYLKRIKEM